MINCLYNGEIICAGEYIGKDDKIGVERIEELKILSKENKLFCVDYDCGENIIFCHGSIKGSYFRHKSGKAGSCEYSKHASERSKFQETKVKLYNHFKKAGLKVNIDDKIIDNHWTDLSCEFSNRRKIAIEIIDRHTGGLRWNEVHDRYHKAGIPDIWILQTEVSQEDNLLDMYFTEMLQIDRGTDNQTLYFDTESDTITVIFMVDIPRKREIQISNICEFTLPYNLLEFNENGQIVGEFLKAKNQCKEERINKYNDLVSEYEIKQKEIIAEKEAEELQRIKQQQELELKRKQEEENKKRKREEALIQHRKTEMDKKTAIHKQTGVYFGVKRGAEYETYTLEQIVATRPPKNYMTTYTRKEFDDRIKEIQEYEYSGVKMLYNKLCFISPDEKKILLEIYNSIKDTDIETAKVLEFLMKKAYITF